MEGDYSFGLRVKVGENQTPRLKNKLVKYFQSKRANGDDCQVDYEQGSETAVVRFRTHDGAFAAQCIPKNFIFKVKKKCFCVF